MQPSNASVSQQFEQFYPRRFVFSSLSASFAPINSLSLHVVSHGTGLLSAKAMDSRASLTTKNLVSLASYIEKANPEELVLN
jgi:hypothetical protein